MEYHNECRVKSYQDTYKLVYVIASGLHEYRWGNGGQNHDYDGEEFREEFPLSNESSSAPPSMVELSQWGQIFFFFKEQMRCKCTTLAAIITNN